MTKQTMITSSDRGSYLTFNTRLKSLRQVMTTVSIQHISRFRAVMLTLLGPQELF